MPGRDGWRAAELIEGRGQLAESGAQFGRVGSEADAEVGVGQFEPRAGDDQGLAVLGHAAVEVTALGLGGLGGLGEEAGLRSAASA